MALDATQKAQLCRILQVTPSQLDSQIEWLGTGFTATHELAVEDEIARWFEDGKGAKFTRIVDKETNYGAVIDPEKEKNDIRKNIAILFERPDWATSGSGTGARLQRA